MKILFIKEKRSPSGIEGIANYLLHVCSELNRLGIAYLLIYNSKDQFYTQLLKNNINVRIVDLPLNSPRNMFQPQRVLETQNLFHNIIKKENITHLYKTKLNLFFQFSDESNTLAAFDKIKTEFRL